MIKILLTFFYGIILSIFHVYCWKRLLFYNQTIKFSLNDWLLVIACALISNISMYIFPQPFKIIIVILLMILVNFIFLSKNLRKSIILVVISQMILVIQKSL